ncbi:MAG: hypothetical protein R8G01_16870 [Ilumatobacteraceae bacterium]|nr:hypothetical protein [Ilumatobacteraceae bacterium]
MKLIFRNTPRPFRRIGATAAAAAAAVVAGVVGVGSIAGAIAESEGDDTLSHGSMMDDMEMLDAGPMGRMHGQMMSGSAEMRRMHAHMMSRHPEMRKMHAEMVSGR